MNLIWTPFWYELDQCIVVGDIDYFFLSKDKTHFLNGGSSEDDYEIRAEIMSIKHKILGNLKGIITIGLDYTFYLANGERLQVNAEETPGKIYDSQYSIEDWGFDVVVKIYEETGMSSKQRLNTMNRNELKVLSQKRTENYKELLNINEL